MSLNLNDLLKGLESDAQIEKTASTKTEEKPAISAELASVLEKKASEDVTKQAFAEGEALARELLSKLATEIQMEQAKIVADDDQKVVPNPTGSVEQVLQGIVDNATASGATTDDRVNHEAKENNVDPAGGSAEAKDPGQQPEKQAADATAQTTKEDTTMNKAASDSDLAKLIMEKLAQEFSAQVTTPAASIPTEGAAAPNKMQQDAAIMVAQDDAKVQGVVPGGDGTVNALYETIVAKAKAQGGQSDDLINGDSHVESRTTQGVDGTPATGESVEKAAAVSALCDAGMDFETAVDLVKQAEEAILAEAWETEKRACFDRLVAEGIDFDQAVALIKQAEEDLANQAE